MTEAREYEKNEYCKDIECKLYHPGPKMPGCNGPRDGSCLKNAKEFHNWLKSKGFKITQEI